MELKLDEKQVEVLKNFLESEISDLGMEIADTDQKDYRDELKEKKEVLKGILASL
ncbi:MAG: hypothetical protein ACC630_02970 [Nitrospinota bacterium]